MKKVIFVCLLTLSVCLSQSSNNTAPVETVASAPNTTIIATPTHEETTTKNSTDNNTTKNNATTTDASTTPDSKKPTNVSTVAPETTTLSTTTSTTTTTTAAPKTSPTSPTTEPTKPADKHDVVVQARGFDGASFTGGIILTLGLLAIGFMGFKYYKAHTEGNYRTL